MTPEEHKRRGDAADDLFREMKREIAEKLREGAIVAIAMGLLPSRMGRAGRLQMAGRHQPDPGGGG